jgi:aarF domain-containing kinase
MSLRTVARRGIAVSLGTASAGVAAGTAYAYTEPGAGFRREVQFWSKVFPIVADYYLKTAESSPWIKYQQWSRSGIYDIEKSNDAQYDGDILKQRRRKLLNSLHDLHAPEILQVMLDLKGLYIKLGQVLSVTALPVPEQYRKLFRTLQSDVPGHEEFESVVKPTIERELGKPLEDIFEYVDSVPCGAASIGQAHRAKLKVLEGDSEMLEEKDRLVIVKVQYPDAVWKIPADIQCVGDFLKICVWAGVVDEESSKLTFEEFSRQYLSELDYVRERQNCQTIYESSLDPSAPYVKNNVVVPKIHEQLCTEKIITMSYIPGVSMEAEAKRQLEMLGIDTSGGIAQIIKDAAQEAARHPDDVDTGSLVRRITKRADQKQKNLFSLKLTASRLAGSFISLDSALCAVRVAKRILLRYQAVLVSSIQKLPPFLVSPSWKVWAEKHSMASEQEKRLGEIDSWCKALFDVHGHQIFNLGLFNAE